MRLAFLSYEYPPETGFGGIGTYVWTQARALARLGHEVHVVAAPVAGTEESRRGEDGVHVWRTAASGAARTASRLALDALGLGWTRRRLLGALDARRGLERVLAGGPIDVVEAPESGAEALFCRRRAPRRTIVRFHSPAESIAPFYPLSTLDRALAVRLERRAQRGASAYTSPSRFLAEEATRRFALARPVEVIPYGVELATYASRRPEEAATALGLPGGRRRVLFVGRLERRKGFETAAEACERLLDRPEVDFVFAGDDLFGSYRERLAPRLRARGAGDRARALGRIGRDELALWLAASDVVLLPSLWDNAPYALLEAMAAGAAIVASEVGGVPELLDHGVEGLLAPAGDADATVEALRALLDDRERARALGAAARRRVAERHAADDVARRSLELYRRVAGAGEEA